jgi:hypothetical protein
MLTERELADDASDVSPSLRESLQVRREMTSSVKSVLKHGRYRRQNVGVQLS